MNTLIQEKGARQGRNRFPVLLTAAAVCVIFATGLSMQPFPADARGWPGAQKSPDEIMDQLKDRLDLTDEQAAAVRPVIEEKAARMNAIRGSAEADRHAVRAEMQKLRWSTERELDKILTEEQVEKYLQLRLEQREKMRGGTFHGKRGKGLHRTPEELIARLSGRLELSEEQEAGIEPVIRASIEKRRAIFDRYRGQREGMRETMRQEIQAARDETQEQLSSVLTDEQIEEFNAMREEKRGRMEKRWKRRGRGWF